MKCLITGSTGFVGKYLREEIKDKFNEIYGIGFNTKHNSNLYNKFFQIDISDYNLVKEVIQVLKPDTVFHLAGQSFIPAAEQNPKKSEALIVNGTKYLLESLYKLKKKVNFIYISSCLIYGNQTNMPIKETTNPTVNNHYSKLKLLAEKQCLSYKNSNLNVLIARPFNHIGIGQKDYFLIPTLCKQVISAIKNKTYRLKLGNINVSRDFLDVKDVVKAYKIIEEKGEPFQIYNICSSKEFSIEDIVNIFKKITNINFKIEVENERIRENESIRSVGDNTKLQSLGWQSYYNLEDSIEEIYKDYLKNDKT